ncbi:serine/threonine protein kinase [Lignipirellula cremea]|uniref:Serine/threonine-protein kinase PrkC n=1 Tax=Lignipirellula cremea TaxID=2528010 RepID=A0A518DTA4_9BACT|nr:serine/threonine-protein kinase [Lignipirellula cremea]QDU95053.1 Serine/threonine-protein kinase PrkC [Lignipirellula cremea]
MHSSSYITAAAETQCPPEETLARFSAGKVEDPQADQIAQHLGRCDLCVSRLDALSVQDELVDRIRLGWRTLFSDRPDGRGSLHSQICEVMEGRTRPFMALPRRIGPYLLRERLGAGGMGVVYEAFHVHLKRVVALKLLSEEQHHPQAIERFLVEMEAIGQLDNPHVVRANDAGLVGDLHYIAMEYVHGCDLGALIRATGPLRHADACAIIHQAAEGLGSIHKAGIIHRDIKPSNIVFSSEAVVKLLDLGLARVTDRDHLSHSNLVLGTIDYMAPEQTESLRAVDYRSDVYSLGCTFFKLLTGQAPFGGKDFASATAKLLAHSKRIPPSVASLAPETPAELCELVARMLAKSPADRPSVADILGTLEAFIGDADLATIARQCPAVHGPPLVNAEITTHRLTATVATSGLLGWSTRLGIGLLAFVGLLFLVRSLFFSASDERPQTPTPAGLASPEMLAGQKPPPVEKFVTAPAEVDPPVIWQQVEPLVWYDLLDRPPQEAYWPIEESTTWSYERKTQSLQLQSTNLGLIQLGEAWFDNYELDVVLFQPEWTGNTGLFLGFSSKIDDSEIPVLDMQLFTIQRVDQQGRDTHYRLERSLLHSEANLFGGRNTSSREAGVHRTDFMHGEQHLSIKVAHGKLVSARINNHDLTSLLTERSNGYFTERDYQGGFGVFTSVSNVTVRSARFRVTRVLR